MSLSIAYDVRNPPALEGSGVRPGILGLKSRALSIRREHAASPEDFFQVFEAVLLLFVGFFKKKPSGRSTRASAC